MTSFCDACDGDEEDDWEEGDEIIRAKWTMDGASTLSEAADQLRSFADSLDSMEKEGWQLVGNVQDDYGFVRKA